MDLNAVRAVLTPRSRAELDVRHGDALLAGGTWLFSEPQPGIHRLHDLQTLAWPPLDVADDLHIAATCTFAQLEAAVLPAEWRARAIIRPACEALLGSFKIRALATVGGNLCLALPAGPIAPLAVALHGTCTVWTPAGDRIVDAADFVVGPQRTVLGPGEILRAVTLPSAALSRRAALRRISLTALGRSAALVIGTTAGPDLQLTVSAATKRPLRLDFPAMPTAAALAERMDAIDPFLHDDVHGAPAWRRHVARLLAEQIRRELA